MFQSLSDEDSFKKMSSTKEVLQKIQQLLSSLVERSGPVSPPWNQTVVFYAWATESNLYHLLEN